MLKHHLMTGSRQATVVPSGPSKTRNVLTTTPMEIATSLAVLFLLIKTATQKRSTWSVQSLQAMVAEHQRLFLRTDMEAFLSALAVLTIVSTLMLVHDCISIGVAFYRLRKKMAKAEEQKVPHGFLQPKAVMVSSALLG